MSCQGVGGFEVHCDHVMNRIHVLNLYRFCNQSTIDTSVDAKVHRIFSSKHS